MKNESNNPKSSNFFVELVATITGGGKKNGYQTIRDEASMLDDDEHDYVNDQPIPLHNSVSEKIMPILNRRGSFTSKKEEAEAIAAAKATNNKHVMMTLGVILVFIIGGLVYLRSTVFTEGRTGDGKHIVTAPMHITVDSSRTIFTVIDNSPVSLPSTVVYSGNAGLEGNLPENGFVLVQAKYMKNYKGSGWNHLAVDTIDLRLLFANVTGTSTGDANPDASSAVDPNTIDIMLDLYLRTMKAMGYAEGYATCHEINEWYVNYYSGLFDGGDPTDESLEFLELNHDWMLSKAEQLYKTSDYWLSVRGLLAQLEGLVAGSREGCPGSAERIREDIWQSNDNDVFLPSMHRKPSLTHMLLLNANGDLFQIAEKFQQQNQPPSTNQFDDDDYSFDNFGNEQRSSRTSSDKHTENHTVGTSKPTYLPVFAPHSLRKIRVLNEDVEVTSVETTTTGEQGDGGRSYAILEASPLPGNGKVWNRKAYQEKKASNPEAIQSKLPSESGRRSHTRSGKSVNDIETFRQTYMNERQRDRRNDHCSAMIKLLDDKSDVVFGHNTWDDFQDASPRIIKHYHFNLFENNLPKEMFTMDFSSSPGLVSSVDDFYLVHGNGHLAVIETSLDIYNPQLLNIIVPESMLSWARARIANQLAYSGVSWAEIFAEYHSGTYVNQWMVLDLRKFKPGQDPLPKFLTVLEEVPGYIRFEDMTPTLMNQSYWASYNNPYFDDIARLTGQHEMCVLDASTCYDTDPRGLIFKERQKYVKSIDDLKSLEGYNNFQNEPYALNNSCNTISCRSDLQPKHSARLPFGAIDAKVSSVSLASMETPSFHARLGPTHDDQPPFCWKQFDGLLNKRGRPYFHLGHPECYSFSWETFPPRE